MIQDIFDLIKKEEERQQNNIELIASENIVSENVLKATGSILTNKYAEGYPEHRYYNGCEFIDKIETIAIEEAKKLFNVEYVNVQPANGSVMNMQVYKALLKNGDIISGQHINMGGHLTHGASVSISGTDYHAIQYGLTSDGYIDYDEIEKIVKENDVKMIVCGASAYSREID
jgi:glycine hydroxymethyltransferase